MSEDVSPANANPIRPRDTHGGGHSSEGDEACHQGGSNEQRHPLGRPGRVGRARVDSEMGESGRPGVARRDCATACGNP